MKLDILVLAAHPDDAELGCGGTILKHVAMGLKVGVVDLTKGELGTRGTPEIRAKEAADSAKILGLSVRENLGLPDGFFKNEHEHQLEVVKAIRKFQPDVVLANARYDRHPDHGRGSELAFEACFLAGLLKVSTTSDGKEQQLWRPKVLYHYIQSQFIAPDFVVDVTDHWEKKMESIRAFRTQFYDPSNKEPDTYISNPGFMKLLESRGNELGHAIGAKYGEGFTVRRFIGVNSLYDLR
ncbi:MAG TPA: bacillithiol biosynthesis deacetylase BshB1 [Cyclobacteriaceae bacterium]|nr:bacillithiol biosynthesis deacetylase BshB1 [Cyclobacteriaceae bacterium]